MTKFKCQIKSNQAYLKFLEAVTLNLFQGLVLEFMRC